MPTVWLNTDEVATLIGVSTQTVRKMVESDALPAYRMGRVIKYRQDEVLVWLETKRFSQSP